MLETSNIPGTPIFDGTAARAGYALNRMCFSLCEARNRQAFLADEAGYCDRYDLTAAQKAAVLSRDVAGMIRAGGNIYYLAKLAGAWGLNVQDVGAQQTGLSVEAFKAKLAQAGAR